LHAAVAGEDGDPAVWPRVLNATAAAIAQPMGPRLVAEIYVRGA
jgi:hypothetical protein